MYLFALLYDRMQLKPFAYALLVFFLDSTLL